MKFAVNASIFSSSKKKLTRGEKKINQLSVLLKFVCCRFAFGFSGPPLSASGVPRRYYKCVRSGHKSGQG